MSTPLSNKIFHDATKAREWLETLLWSNGRPCGYCGVVDHSSPLKTRPGYYQCKSCRKQFTVMVGTVFERSHIPLNKWLMAAFLLCASKKGMSAHQMHRILGVTYKSAWFMCHRLREAMRQPYHSPDGKMGGEGETVEADEAYIGPSIARDTRLQRLSKERRERKLIVFTLVERGGRARSFNLKAATRNNLMGVLQDQTHYKSRVMTDENYAYRPAGRAFKGGHGTIRHAANRYVRLGDV
jgi:transposase-like protein